MSLPGLRGKRVIITGGAAGIGRATVLRFSQEGPRIAVWDVNEQQGAALAKEILASGTEARFAKVDVTDKQQVDTAITSIASAWGGIDVLVNNAGITRDAQLVKMKDGSIVGTMTDSAFDAVLSVNLKGVFVCTRAVVPYMVRSGGGVVLNASSVVGLYGNFGQTNYAATKAGVIAFTRTWARELGKYNIRVNAVAPGFIATDMVAAMPEKVLDGMRSHTPLGRLGRPEDVANAYVWLASDEASFVHGAVLSVDGGIVPGT
jgi:3-oxoacyl-[acyl-carrier protein] reductase